MQIALRLQGGEPEESLRSLRDWLLADRTVRRDIPQATLGSSLAPEPGQQGSVIDVLSLIVNSGLSAGSLAVSVATWRATRPGVSTVTIERADGASVTISHAEPDEAQRLVRELLGERPGPS
ncbi:hypothetical protein ACIGXA_08360 [Streptomyces fildesensis]|uniref:Uncharacterized protein n=1 Tax=Streptomyces fildesensis TaxID=375757 RepID=A0ABW8C3S5_9ACTN